MHNHIGSEVNEILRFTPTEITNIFFQGLKGLDMNGLCDSYCKITLVPSQPKVKQWVHYLS